jgi:hypothetical protein
MLGEEEKDLRIDLKEVLSSEIKRGSSQERGVPRG